MTQPDPTQIAIGPGRLYVAPIGTAEPTSPTAALPSAWIPLGYTENGSEFTYTTTLSEVLVEEELDPVQYRATKREGSLKFLLAEVNAFNLQVALNGGLTAPTPAGGAVSPNVPTIGNETRVMVLWDADTGDERWVYRRCVNGGALTLPRRKAPAKATISMEFRLEKPVPAGDGRLFVPLLLASTRTA